MLAGLKRVLIGSPLKTNQLAHERLTNMKALAVFSSDALSSVAYATEEILLMLILAGSAALKYSIWVSIAIGLLMVVVGFSYRQTIFAYPGGGGSYIVAKENLSQLAGLTAASALLIDYVLTVAVSISSGVAAITSAFPNLLPHRVLLVLLAIALITLVNLRGLKDSGTIFALPTYLFIFSTLIMIGVGLFKSFTGGLVPPTPAEAVQPIQNLTLFLVLRAFASGCSAMTGVEAISDGVQAFKDPVSKNASKTLTWMITILLTMFIGISYLSYHVGIHPLEHETVLSQLARTVFGTGWMYYVLQTATALILFMAANTSYADFPRLSYFVARDGFLPRQLANRGDRLVFSNGIVVLGLLAATLVIIFGGDYHPLIPLYAVGVFLSFTLSQSGMVMRWYRSRHHDKHWLGHALINGIGALTTFVVLLVIGVTKFMLGAYMVVMLIPVIVLVFLAIHRHYQDIANDLRMSLDEPIKRVKHTIIVPVASVNKMVAQTLNYALSLSDDVRCVHVSIDEEATKKIKAKWDTWGPGVPLHIVESPYRSLTRPLLHYVDRVERKEKDDMVTVMVPEFVPRRWWHHLLHNQSALVLKALLRLRRHTVVVSVPYHLKD